ncbi:MAG TPA: peptidoglycan-binding domain-containing protein [Pseudolabrys sp.]|nr:peptidoglycan-binding domain-containing protein [Pseudolabrys sp.]
MPRRRQEEPEIESDGGGIAAVIARHPRETVGIVMATAATLAIFINALFLQRGPHPAPIFASRPLVHSVRKIALPPARVAPPPARVTPAPPPVAAAPHDDRGQLVADIQQELGRKGFYDGPIDGLWGAKTDAAVRAFEQAAGIKLETQASDHLLRTIKASAVRAKASAAPTRPHDPIAKLLAPSAGAQASGSAAPSARVLAVQRTLAEFGYGQIRPTGVVDADTRAAIEKFERQRGLPVTGRYSERLVQALSAMSGHSLE